MMEKTDAATGNNNWTPLIQSEYAATLSLYVNNLVSLHFSTWKIQISIDTRNDAGLNLPD